VDELIDRITSAVGIDEEAARGAVSIILNFLRTEGPADKVDELIAQLGRGPESPAEDDPGGGLLGGLGGLVGSSTMAVLGKLQGIGLGMGEIQGVTREIVAFSREKVGDDAVDEIVGAIPGLRQFV